MNLDNGFPFLFSLPDWEMETELKIEMRKKRSLEKIITCIAVIMYYDINVTPVMIMEIILTLYEALFFTFIWLKKKKNLFFLLAERRGILPVRKD